MEVTTLGAHLSGHSPAQFLRQARPSGCAALTASLAVSTPGERQGEWHRFCFAVAYTAISTVMPTVDYGAPLMRTPDDDTREADSAPPPLKDQAHPSLEALFRDFE